MGGGAAVALHLLDRLSSRVKTDGRRRRNAASPNPTPTMPPPEIPPKPSSTPELLSPDASVL